jgi:Ni,Fe-hydrogenase I cytochrome b subunit
MRIRRRLGHFAIKTVRFTSWPLLAIVIAFIVTGYAMSGQYGMGAVLDPNTAKVIHRFLHLPLGALALAHALCATYLAFRRWRWIRW